MAISQLQKELRALGSKEKVLIYQYYFKTGPGEYAEGDKFLGITMPETRKAVTPHSNLSLKELKTILQSKYNDERLAALLILVKQFEKGNPAQQKRIYNFYMQNKKQINNWNLIDLSADKIVGEYLKDKPKGILYTLARSKNLWERRIAIIATFQYIKENNFTETLKIAAILLSDSHDLIHKATGWMLREVGKRDQKVEEQFLKSCYKQMPRTMLRYAIERFPEAKRQAYLKGTA